MRKSRWTCVYVGLFFCFYSFAHAQESDVNLECKGWKTGDAPRACSVEGEGGTVQVVGTCIADGKCKGVYYIKDGVKCFIGTNYCGQLPASSVQNSSGQILTLPTDLGGGLESALPPPTTIESPQVGGANSTYAPPSYTDIGNFETETFTESGSSAGNTEASTQPDLRTNTFLSERWAEGKIETLQVSPDLTPAAGMSGLPEVSENPFSLGSPSVHNDDPLAFGDDLLAESQTLSDGTKLQILEQRVSSAQKLVDETQSALSVYSDPQNSYAISYEGLPPAQDAADRATAALEAAQNDLAKFKVDGTIPPGSSADAISHAEKQIKEGQGTFSRFFRGLEDAGKSFTTQPQPFTAEEYNQMPYNVRAAYSQSQGMQHLGGVAMQAVGHEFANTVELLGSNQSAEKAIACASLLQGCTGEQIMSATNVATLAVGGIPLRVEAAAMEGVGSAITAARTVATELPRFEAPVVDLVRGAEGIWGLPTGATALEARVPALLENKFAAIEFAPSEISAGEALAGTLPERWVQMKAADDFSSERFAAAPESTAVSETVGSRALPETSVPEGSSPILLSSERTYTIPLPEEVAGSRITTQIDEAIPDYPLRSVSLPPASPREANSLVIDDFLRGTSADDITIQSHEVSPLSARSGQYVDAYAERLPEDKAMGILPAREIVVSNNGASVTLSSESFSAADGVRVITSPEQYQKVLKEFIPETDEYNAFAEAKQFTTSGSYEARDAVLAIDDHGALRRIDRAVYNELKLLGDEIYGTPQLVENVFANTNGKIYFDQPYDFPKPYHFKIDSFTPYDQLRPLVPLERSIFIDQVSEAASQLPPSLYANLDTPIKIYGYAPVKGAVINQSGLMADNNEYMWIKGGLANSSEVPNRFYHELAHALDDSQVLPTDESWGIQAHGPEWTSAYGAKSATEAIRSGVWREFGRNDRPEGFACAYGHCSGVAEDKATVVEYMLSKYPEMVEAAKTDTVLATKMEMVKDSFYYATGGEMDEAWWNNKAVTNSSLTVPPSTREVAEAFGLEYELWSVAPTPFPPYQTLDELGGAFSEPVGKWLLTARATFLTWLQSIGWAF